ncbi:nucleotidyltransferase domain-containing protein [Patescibacteria group bacterium]|nr:nucleotidyltransferase domain-containing protein [Patescibacteria group bacterium]
MSKSEAIKIVKKYAKELKKNNFSFSQIFLFGSYAKGSYKKDSDIDVAVVSDQVKKFNNIFLLRRMRRQIDTRIEPHAFTIADFKNLSDPLVYEIKKTGIKI